MPIPVPIPSGPLPITDQVTIRAEAWLEAFIRAVEYGTTGATLNTPASTIDLPNSGGVQPVIINTPEKQLFFRQNMIALAATLLQYANATQIGITRLSSNPADPNFPTALNSEEVTTVPTPNKVPRARVDGTLDPGWLTGTPGPGPTLIQTFTGNCLSGDIVGDIMYVNAASKVVRKVDITDFTKTPAVGCIVSKPTATTCVVQTAGLVTSVYSGLTPGKIYVVGTNSRPALTLPVPAPSTTLFLQQIGIAIDTDMLLISPASQLTKIRG